jgi:hypothetical protein
MSVILRMSSTDCFDFNPFCVSKLPTNNNATTLNRRPAVVNVRQWVKKVVPPT